MDRLYKYRLAIYVIAGLAVTGVFFVPLISRGLEMWTDSYYYLSGGRNIAAGNGFSHGCHIIEPITRWPPLYSLYLSVFYLFDTPWYRMFENIAVINFCVFAVICAFIVHKLRTGILTGVLMMVLLLFHPYVLRWAASALSESTSWLWLGFAELLVLAIASGGPGGRQRNYVLLAIVLSFGFLTRYAFAGVIIAAAGFFMLRYLQEKVSVKNVAIFCIVVALLCGGWLVRNYYIAGAAAESDGSDTRLFRNVYYAIMNFWDVFSLWRPDNLLLSLLIFLLIPLFGYRAYINGRRPGRLPGFIAFNYLLILFYTATIILLRTTSAAITLDNRMFSLLIFPFVFVLPDIKARWARVSVLSVLIILSAARYRDILHADTVYQKVFGYTVYQKAMELGKNHRIYTFDPTVLLMDPRYCMDDRVLKLDRQVLKQGLAQNEIIVVFNNTYKFERYKDIYEDLLRKNLYRRQQFADGAIFYP